MRSGVVGDVGSAASCDKLADLSDNRGAHSLYWDVKRKAIMMDQDKFSGR